MVYFSNLDWDSIKLLLYTQKSALVGMHASNNFLKYYDGKSIWTCDVDYEKVRGNHAVMIDGYGEENGIKFLWVRNSWGEDWGINGHFKMDFNKSCGINDKFDMGNDDEQNRGIYDIRNFVTSYTLTPETKDESEEKSRFAKSNANSLTE